MPANLDKPYNWKGDIALSVDMYNQWFLDFAPKAFRKTRATTTGEVEKALRNTANLTDITPEVLQKWPGMLRTLRMSTCPPLAVDRLIALADVPASLVKSLEQNKLPARMEHAKVLEGLARIGAVVKKMADPDIFVWIDRSGSATDLEVDRAATIVADRLCGSVANPIIRNAQEHRQLACMAQWLEAKGYRKLSKGYSDFRTMLPGTYCFRMNVPAGVGDGSNAVKVFVDVGIMRHDAATEDFPLLIEAKSAGDFANTNKRRKEEAQKINQLRKTYGNGLKYILFLCGYFDSGYLGYEAAEGVDWVWEHRIDDLMEFGL